MNIQEIDKWLDNEYGTSYTRLGELHDYFFEKYTDQKEEIERLNNIIKKIVSSCYNSDMTLGEFKEIWHIAFNEEYIIGNLERLQELKGSDKE